MAAAYHGHNEIAEILIQNNAEVLAELTYQLEPLLMIAARNGLKNILEILIQKNIDVNQRTSSGSSALIEAAIHGRSEIVKILIKNNATVNAKSCSFNYVQNACQYRDDSKMDMKPRAKIFISSFLFF